MAEASKSSFLGSISPWVRSSTPPPKSPRQVPKPDESLKQPPSNDHSVSLRPTPSLRRYPKDCPPLKTRWYYAVDVAKRKPFGPQPSAENLKPQPVPKKWMSFSSSDSKAIENAFQALDKQGSRVNDTNAKPTSTKVPVNEDYLFDVHVEQRELEPAYWLGPVHEVRRGSWFTTDGVPCDENLARQLEEGYLKVTPWKKSGHQRSASQPRPSSAIIDSAIGFKPKDAQAPAAEAAVGNTTRLFGAHMNTIVTYQDANVAYMSADDFMSRIGSSVYTRFGAQSGTKLIRGYSEPTKAVDVKDKEKVVKDDSTEFTQDAVTKTASNSIPTILRPSLLERQLSSLAGLTKIDSRDEEDKMAEEDARQAQEQEMEDARENDGDDQGRKIDHLVLVTHGIGQRLGLRLDSINFIHDVNTLRKTMKAVYGTAPDLKALTDNPGNCSIQVLPVCWRHLLDFPRQSLKQNRKEFDLGDMDSALEDEYPSLQDITVEGVPAVRNLITDLAMDVLLYQSAYREHIASIVQKEANRVYHLFKKRTGFEGKVSLCGHSLGSAILFDILCRQGDAPLTRPRRVSSRTTREFGVERNDLKFDFECENFFALGSPIALFQMLKGRTVAGRSALHDKAPVTSPFDPEPTNKDPFSSAAGAHILPIAVSSPKCAELFNIFHPTDPIAYRIEPLISPAMAQLKSQPLPYVKKGLFGAPGIANMTARVGQNLMSGWYSLTSGVASSLINRSLGITGEEQALSQDKAKSDAGSLTSLAAGTSAQALTPSLPVAAAQKQQDLADSAREPGQPETLIDTEIETLFSGFQKQHRSRRPSESSTASTGDPQATTAAINEIETLESAEKARRLKREEQKVRALNSNGRVDYHIQEGMFDVSLLASIASHLSYWADEDVNHFMIGQMLKKGRAKGRKRDESKLGAGLGFHDGGDSDVGDMSMRSL